MNSLLSEFIITINVDLKILKIECLNSKKEKK